MSKIDQAFVKAFAKVRPRTQSPSANPAATDLAALGTSSIWVDPSNNDIMRVDEPQQPGKALSGRRRGSRPPSPSAPMSPLSEEIQGLEQADHSVTLLRIDPAESEPCPERVLRARLDASAFPAITVAHDTIEDRIEPSSTDLPRSLTEESIIRIDAPVPASAPAEGEQAANIQSEPAQPAEVQSSIDESAGHEAIASKPAIHQAVTSEAAISEAAINEAAINEAAISEAVISEPVTSEAAINEPVTSEPVSSEPAINEPVTNEPVTNEPVTNEPVTSEAVTSEPVTSEPVGIEPVSSEPVGIDAAYLEPVSSEPVSPVRTAFEAEWEVDRFEVPETVEEMLTAGGMISAAGLPLAAAARDGMQTVAITSPQRGAGRSTIAIALALSAATTGLRVALVDGDWIQPSLVDQLQLDIEFGWPEAVRGGVPLCETAVHSVRDGVTLFPIIPSEVGRPVEAGELRKTIDQLRHDFELIIVDVPSGEAELPTDCFQSAIVIRDLRDFNKAALDRTVAAMQAVGIGQVGIAENFGD